jgi:alkanesulfonate monooxygenase SsuD/methylene tetrahydromethanopterin reductase-like flavin-dependent oxidoreductase (luciferase family)
MRAEKRMTSAVQLYCWHFMAYPHLPADFDETYDTGWVTVPNSLWDKDRSRGLYQQYIDQLAYADELGFDGMVLNEHHQNIYGLMPSPNLIAAALTQRTKRGKIVILGNLLPLHLNPLRVAEEYAMLDNMSDGRLIAGFAPGSGPETFNYNVPSAPTRTQFWEAVDFISKAWTQPGPFAFEGRHYPMRYVNPWPQPTQKPHPPIWIPGSRSRETLVEIAKRGYSYFLSSRSHGKETARSQQMFAKILEEHGDRYKPQRMGILMSAYVAEADAQAQAEAKEGVWYFLKNCLKGHLRREGRQLTFGPGIPYIPPEDYERFLQTDPTTPLLGDAETWEDLQQSASIIVGSAETVYRRIMDILTHSKVGNLLIQFHLGNMQDALTRKSMTLFAREVAPRLREDSAKLFGREFPDTARAPEMAK